MMGYITGRSQIKIQVISIKMHYFEVLNYCKENPLIAPIAAEIIYSKLKK